MVQVALGQSLVDELGSASTWRGLVGVLNAQDKGASGIAGDEPGVQGGTQIADVHIARGRGGKTGTDLPLWGFWPPSPQNTYDPKPYCSLRKRLGRLISCRQL